MLQHSVLVTNIFSEVNVWQAVFGSLLYLLAIITRHLQRKTNRRILLPSLTAAPQLQGLGSELNVKLFVWAAGWNIPNALPASEAPRASLPGTDGEEEWGQKENLKKEVAGHTAVCTQGLAAAWRVSSPDCMEEPRCLWGYRTGSKQHRPLE